MVTRKDAVPIRAMLLNHSACSYIKQDSSDGKCAEENTGPKKTHWREKTAQAHEERPRTNQQLYTARILYQSSARNHITVNDFLSYVLSLLFDLELCKKPSLRLISGLVGLCLKTL